MSSKTSKFREAAILFLIIAGIFAARSSLADHYHVPSGSMEYTLFPGDRVIVDKRAYGLRVPFTHLEISAGEPVARGDVAIFDSPRDGTRLIKRIVAVAGDEVRVLQGRLYINGREESFADSGAILKLASGGGPDFSATVPAGKVLALGDHRGNSVDGRIFGWVDESLVYGRAVAVYYRSDAGFVWNEL